MVKLPDGYRWANANEFLDGTCRYVYCDGSSSPCSTLTLRASGDGPDQRAITGGYAVPIIPIRESYKLASQTTRLEQVLAGKIPDPYNKRSINGVPLGPLPCTVLYGEPRPANLQGFESVEQMIIAGPDATGDDVAADATSIYWRK